MTLSEAQIEELPKYEFLMKDSPLIEPPYQLYRLTSQHEGRFYWRMRDDESLAYYASVTTLIAATSNSPFLTQWVGSLGNAEAERQRDSAAEYGTALHHFISKFNILGEFNTLFLDIEIMQYCEKERPKYPTGHWAREMLRDLLAWQQFVQDYNVQPIAIEIMLCSDRLKMAGALDLVCEMDYHEKGFWGEVLKSGPNAGQPKETKRTRRIVAIIDVKSGRKGFYDSHKRQLKAYQFLLRENCPGFEAERLFNWSPKDWKTDPDYNFTDQTDGTSDREVELMAELFWERHGSFSTRRDVVMRPILKLGESAVGIIRSVSLQEYFAEWRQREKISQLDADPVGNGELF